MVYTESKLVYNAGLITANSVVYYTESKPVYNGDPITPDSEIRG